MKSNILTLLLVLASSLSQLSVSAQMPTSLGKLTSSKLTEVSGMVPHSNLNGYFWVHNDSGDKNAIYLIDSLAQLKLEVELKGVKAVDFEDIASYSDGVNSYLLVGDIGNNLRDRDTLSIYVFEEPKFDKNISSTVVEFKDIKRIKYFYKDKARDAEGFFVDPIDKHVYIISKRDLKSTVFRFPFDLNSNQVYVLSPLLSLPFTFCTAVDISKDGRHILVKNLTSIFYWERLENETVLNALSKTYKTLPYMIEPQGEAICFDLLNRNFFTISERPFGLDSYLYKYIY